MGRVDNFIRTSFEEKVKSQTLKSRNINYNYDIILIEILCRKKNKFLYRNHKHFVSSLSKKNGRLLGPKYYYWKGDTKFYSFDLPQNNNNFITFLLPVSLTAHISKDTIFKFSSPESFSINFNFDTMVVNYLSPILLRNKQLHSCRSYRDINYFFKISHSERNWCITDTSPKLLPPFAVFYTQLLMKNIDFSRYDAAFSSVESNYQNPCLMYANRDKILIPGFYNWDSHGVFFKVLKRKDSPLCLCPHCRKEYFGFSVIFKSYGGDYVIHFKDIILA